MYESFEPAPKLEPFVECFWKWSLDASGQPIDDILPDVAPELIVHLAGRPLAQADSGDWLRQEPAFLYCAARKSLKLWVREPLQVFAVRFRPWGIRRFSGMPMEAILDRPIAPGAAFPAFGDDLVASLKSAGSDEALVRIANRILVNAMKAGSSVEPRLEKLLEASGGGRCSAAEMAEKLSISGRSFSRLWNDVVGIQPRAFVQLMRFHNALEMISSGTDLTTVAAECGYSDQAHMARQIKAIAGLPPSALRQRLGSKVYRDLYASRPGAPWHSA